MSRKLSGAEIVLLSFLLHPVVSPTAQAAPDLFRRGARERLAPGEVEVEGSAGWVPWWGSLKARSRAFDASRQDLYGDGWQAGFGFRQGIRPWGPFDEISVAVRFLDVDGKEDATHRLRFGDEVFPRGSRVRHDLAVRDVFIDTLFLHYRHVRLDLESPGHDKTLQQDLLMFTLGNLGGVTPLSTFDGGSTALVTSGRFSAGDFTFSRFAAMIEFDVAYGVKTTSDWVFSGGVRANYFYMTERLDSQGSIGPYLGISKSW